MRITLLCSAPYGAGGLGQHFRQLVEETRTSGDLSHYLTSLPAPGDPLGIQVATPLASRLIASPPVRFSPGWRNFVGSEAFDRAAAAVLPPGDTLVAFGGQALHVFRRARALGYQRLVLVAANSHVENVWQRHRTAIARYGIESSWLNRTQVRKTLREYRLAQGIWVASEYSRRSFLSRGVPPDRVHLRPLTPDPRFAQAMRAPADGVFRIVYVGSLTVTKGIPVLLEAFDRLNDPSAELLLVGGWTTRGMRLYLRRWQARRAGIVIAPGDPLPYLQQAAVYVHPTFEDGFAYAPMEALAMGVPVIVTEDTGMREYVREGNNGFIVPTGNSRALVERLQAIRRGGMASARSTEWH